MTSVSDIAGSYLPRPSKYPEKLRDFLVMTWDVQQFARVLGGSKSKYPEMTSWIFYNGLVVSGRNITAMSGPATLASWGPPTLLWVQPIGITKKTNQLCGFFCRMLYVVDIDHGELANIL